MKKHVKHISFGIVVIFALIGAGFVAVFLAMQFGLLNVRGTIDGRNQFFLGTTTPELPRQPCDDVTQKICAWNATPEWDVVKGGLQKDAAVIARVSGETGIPARLLAAVVIPEQIRFFTSEREVFKRYFEPLKILGSLSQFSLGVSGIKQETALQIEQYANDPTSPFYPGDGFAKLLAYTDATTTPRETQLFNRLTDEKNHYYSYLYTAVFLKEIEMQWSRAGFPIDTKADILVTLFNIGFERSKPNPTPVAAGAPISVGGTTYAFGTLGGLFFASNELLDIFPR
ncbi:MAG: hypothetical protein ABA06_03620 [Parcubacteria bacterium C7867-001]|nr:MAG: hypothetical protein ABA06_03620 [Parcubacteria bacterium C7867-001]